MNPCLNCIHCKTRVFRTYKELSDWCYKREKLLRRNWKRDLNKVGKIRLFWCGKGIKGPRIFATGGPPFQENCTMFKF